MHHLCARNQGGLRPKSDPRGRPEFLRKIRRPSEIGGLVDPATAHRWVSLGHPESAVLRQNQRFCSGFAPRTLGQVASLAKDHAPSKAYIQTLLSPEATEVSHGVHSQVSRKFAAVPAKIAGKSKNGRQFRICAVRRSRGRLQSWPSALAEATQNIFRINVQRQGLSRRASPPHTAISARKWSFVRRCGSCFFSYRLVACRARGNCPPPAQGPLPQASFHRRFEPFHD